MDAGCVCGGDVLRGGLYAADSGAEECRSDSGVAFIEPGVGVFGTGRMGDFGTEAERERIVWVWADVFGDCVGADAAEKMKGDG